MKKIIFFHHTNFGIDNSIPAIQSLAALEHISSFNSEIENIDFMSFMNSKDNTIYVLKKNFSPWILNKFFSFLFRFIHSFILCFKYDKIIIYHSLSFIYFLPAFLFFRSKITIQLNEVYSEISDSKKLKILEKAYLNFFKNFIASNIYLKAYLKNESNIFIRGGYFKPSSNSIKNKKEKPYFVYAGLVDELKMGNFSILESLIKTIPNKNIFYLCVITSDEFYSRLEEIIVNRPNVFLYRNLPKEKLFEIYNLCNYGLVVQDSNKVLNKTSFPSKIFSYLNNNITPIVVSNGVLEKSEIESQMFFIENYNWEEILNANKSDIDINSLSKIIIKDFKKFIYE